MTRDRFLYVETLNREKAVAFAGEEWDGAIPTRRFGNNDKPIFAVYKIETFGYVEPHCERCGSGSELFVTASEEVICESCAEDDPALK